MEIEQWWPRLQPSTREWLIANNGDRVPRHIAQEVLAADGPDLEAVSEAEATPGCFPEEVVDWIEAVANNEEPESS